MTSHPFDNENLPRRALHNARHPGFAPPHGPVSFDNVHLWTWPGAAAFASDPALKATKGVIAEIALHPLFRILWEAFAAGETDLGLVADPEATFAPARRRGRKPREGWWPLLYLAYVDSGSTNVSAWYDEVDKSIFGICGFLDGWIPDAKFVDRRFAQLENYWRVFAALTRWLVANAKRYVPWLGDIVFVDGHLFQSPAELLDACALLGRAERCAQLIREEQRKRNGRYARTLKSDDPKAVTEARAAEQRAASPDGEDDQPTLTRRHRIELPDPITGHRRWYRVFKIRRHYWISRDLSSGARSYGDTFTFGGNAVWATSGIPTLPLEVAAIPADVQERDANPEIFEGLTASCGPPRLWSGDSHHSTNDSAEFLIRRGASLIAPRVGEDKESYLRRWRKPESHDEHGICRCQTCGGEGNHDVPKHGLVFPGGEPHLSALCQLTFSSDDRCSGALIPCERDFRALQPLSRYRELYHAIRQEHDARENTNKDVPRRTNTAMKFDVLALGRSGVEAQQLRLWAALLLAWVRASFRNGWLDAETLDVTRNTSKPERRSGLQDLRTRDMIETGVGLPRLRRLIAERHAENLHLPIGRNAEFLLDALAAARRQGQPHPWAKT